MQFAILRHGKIKAPQLGAAVAHNHRTSSVEKVNIDATRTPLNMVATSAGTVAERVAEKLKALTTKVRKDAVVAVELVLSASPEWFNGLTADRAGLVKHPKFKQWANASVAWARQEFGRNVVDVSLHMDESSPHIHVLAVPLTMDGRLCAKDVLAKKELIRRQDSYSHAMRPLGLDRGQAAKDTKRRHIKLTEEPEGAGGRASALAAALVKAQAEIARLQAMVSRLQGFNMDYSRQLTVLEKRLADKESDLAKLAEREQATPAVEPPKDTAQEAAERAQAAFLDEHKGLPRASKQQVAVGVLVASEGRWAVLHIGRGRHVLHELPPEAERQQERTRSRGPSQGR
jgi:hypothetical protein